MEHLKRITFDSKIMGGKPCIRGMRVTVSAVVGLIAVGHSFDEILAAYPYLEAEDLRESLALCGLARRGNRNSARCMKILIDMNLSPDWAKVLEAENVESACYPYRYTNDEKYLRTGKTFFDDFVKRCRTDEGYANLKNVVTKEKSDSMQSFLFAETFKYYYLLFAPPQTLDFNRIVFNTEAHPIAKAR